MRKEDQEKEMKKEEENDNVLIGFHINKYKLTQLDKVARLTKLNRSLLLRKLVDDMLAKNANVLRSQDKELRT